MQEARFACQATGASSIQAQDVNMGLTLSTIMEEGQQLVLLTFHVSEQGHLQPPVIQKTWYHPFQAEQEASVYQI
eukprot:1140710-Pelagomonas_calceolata.AAC.6